MKAVNFYLIQGPSFLYYSYCHIIKKKSCRTLIKSGLVEKRKTQKHYQGVKVKLRVKSKMLQDRFSLDFSALYKVRDLFVFSYNVTIFFMPGFF